MTPPLSGEPVEHVEPVRVAPAATEYEPPSSSTSDVTIIIHPAADPSTQPSGVHGAMGKSIRSSDTHASTSNLVSAAAGRTPLKRLDEKATLFATFVNSTATTPDKHLLDWAEAVRILRDEHDYYAVLKIPPTETNQNITKQYRELSLMVHPDKNQHPNSTKAFLVLSSAYTTLNNPLTRMLYDAYLVDMAHVFDRTQKPYDSWVLSGKEGSRPSSPGGNDSHPRPITHLPRWLQPVLNTPCVGVTVMGFFVLLALPLLLLWLLYFTLWYTLFMPIKACSGIDSRSSKDPVTADSEGSPEESPNTTHESTKSPPHLAVALDSVSSLEQPLRHSARRNGGGSKRGSMARSAERQNRALPPRTSPKFRLAEQCSKVSTMGLTQEETNLLSLFHSLRADEEGMTFDATRARPSRHSAASSIHSTAPTGGPFASGARPPPMTSTHTRQFINVMSTC